MDDHNITMEQYIRLEEENARRRGKVYNWRTATYGKIWYDEDIHDLRSVETEFLAIVFNDSLTSEVTLTCEPTVSPLNDNKIDFRISFDESDDEDYTVIFNKNSFSYKIISVNDLKTDSKNDNEKVNVPLFLSPEPSVSYFDDLDFLKDFEKEFPAIVYNDALTSKFDFLTEPTVSPQHIDAFNLKDETSLSECDKEEQNVLYFNDLFSFNVIYPDDSKSDKDNDDDKINIKHSSGGNVINTDDGAYAQRFFENKKISLHLKVKRTKALDNLPRREAEFENPLLEGSMDLEVLHCHTQDFQLILGYWMQRFNIPHRQKFFQFGIYLRQVLVS
ncbi:hypothetical protein Tco_0524558 [Tanacetum coccineum]